MAKRQDDYRSAALDGHALAIGYVCIEWARLEMYLDSLLGVMIPLEERDIFYGVTGNIDFREKIQILLVVAHERQISRNWFESLKKELDKIDNELRPERNRIVHDYWLLRDENAISRRSLKTTLQRPQAFEPFKLTTVRYIETTDEDIWTIAKKINQSLIELWKLSSAYLKRGRP